MRPVPRLLIIISGAAILGAAAFLVRLDLAQNMTNHETSDETVRASGLPPRIRTPRIVIKKGERLLELYDGESLIRSYKVVLGFAPAGDKEREGDGKTPEGEFYLFTRNPNSRFHLSLGISYPSKDDAERGIETGLISRSEHDAIVKAIERKKTPPQKTALGGEIYIHGGGIERDWTEGCIAMKNAEIEELYNAVPVGAKVAIVP
jgi:murein L,D-transpeptidase YafK